MSSERLIQGPENKLHAWLSETDPSTLHSTVFTVWERASYYPNRYNGYSPYSKDYRQSAEFFHANKALKNLYEHVYPERTSDEDLLNVSHIDAQTITFHHKLLSGMDWWGVDEDLVGERELRPMLFGAEPAKLKIYGKTQPIEFEQTPAIQRRVAEGMSSELRVLVARMRMDIFGAHLRSTTGVYPHDTLWWREKVVETLQLTPQELDLIRELGVLEDASAA